MPKEVVYARTDMLLGQSHIGTSPWAEDRLGLTVSWQVQDELKGVYGIPQRGISPVRGPD